MRDEIIIGVVSGLAVAILMWVVKVIRDAKHTQSILKFLRNSKESTEFSFRSNYAIASATNLSEDRVRKLCSKSKKIKRNEKEKESWKLIE